MKFEIKELKDKKLKYFEVGTDKNAIKNLKQNIDNFDALSISFDALNLGTKLYGDGKKQSIEIQKLNASQVILVFKNCLKAVKILKKNKVDFDGAIYISNLKNKKNNNDLMIIGMLDAKLNYNIFKRMFVAVSYACDFLDKENEINNMCDFKDNKCVNHRENNINKNTGCCPSFCKYTQCKTCTVKNISCKIFMCNYLEDKGYYFTPHTIPILKRHLNILERFMCFGLLFKTTKKTVSRLWLVRALIIAYAVVISSAIILPIVL